MPKTERLRAFLQTNNMLQLQSVFHSLECVTIPHSLHRVSPSLSTNLPEFLCELYACNTTTSELPLPPAIWSPAASDDQHQIADLQPLLRLPPQLLTELEAAGFALPPPAPPLLTEFPSFSDSSVSLQPFHRQPSQPEDLEYRDPDEILHELELCQRMWLDITARNDSLRAQLVDRVISDMSLYRPDSTVAIASELSNQFIATADALQSVAEQETATYDKYRARFPMPPPEEPEEEEEEEEDDEEAADDSDEEFTQIDAAASVSSASPPVAGSSSNRKRRHETSLQQQPQPLQLQKPQQQHRTRSRAQPLDNSSKIVQSVLQKMVSQIEQAEKIALERERGRDVRFFQKYLCALNLTHLLCSTA